MPLLTNHALGVKLGEYLRGSATSEFQAMESLDMDEELFNNTQFCDGLDSVVFCCAGCGWWCGTDEMSEAVGNGHDQFCNECEPEEDD